MGRRIFLEQMGGLGAGFLLDLKQRQYVFRDIVEPSFVNLDFDTDSAAHWWLLKRSIVLDPARSFGQPIVAANGVATARMAQAVEAEGSVARAAQLFEMKPALVRDALAFDRRGSTNSRREAARRQRSPAAPSDSAERHFRAADQVIALREKFGRSNLKDEEQIPAPGREGGWAVLSADMKIARKRPSRELFVRAGLVGSS